MSTTFDLGKYHCTCAGGNADHAVYILYPMDSIGRHVDSLARKFGMSIIAVTGFDWDNDLTPWPAAGVPIGSPDFEGRAADFLNILVGRIIPASEESLGISPKRRDLVGVSLSGLFTVWQWASCRVFSSIASLSGSFWYEGFVEWFEHNFPSHADGRAYLSLGDREGHTRIKQFKNIPADTEAVVATMRRASVDVTFESVPGNHYQHAEQRLTKALEFLTRKA